MAFLLIPHSLAASSVVNSLLVFSSVFIETPFYQTLSKVKGPKWIFFAYRFFKLATRTRSFRLSPP